MFRVCVWGGSRDLFPPTDPHISPHHPGHSPLLTLLCRPGRSGKESSPVSFFEFWQCRLLHHLLHLFAGAPSCTEISPIYLHQTGGSRGWGGLTKLPFIKVLKFDCWLSRQVVALRVASRLKIWWAPLSSAQCGKSEQMWKWLMVTNTFRLLTSTNILENFLFQLS